ncbi:ABC transporter permease [Bifidobacterium favimelis]|uniref:ABC transporter permease n=1 Tax=Bifidobacterium favimelis TaxID=3122979 RepID=A0ABU8ZN48_9BIFI
MYIITNALKNIWRYRGRSLLFAATALSIIAICTTGVLIRNASGTLIDGYHGQFGSKVTLGPDLAKATPGSTKQPTTAQYLDFGRSELLQKAVYTAHMSGNVKGLTMLDEEEEGKYESHSTGSPEGMGAMPKSNLVGYDDPSISEEFTSGKRRIVDGRKYSGDRDCLISQQLAKLNHLKVGDAITFTSLDNGDPGVRLRISGIYADSTMNGKAQQQFKTPMLNRGNEILMSQQAARKLPAFVRQGYLEPEFYLKNPDQLDAFRKELKAKGLPDDFKVSTDEAAYKKVVAPVESLRRLATIFLALVLVLGGLVLLFLCLMAMRSRAYEIGVLRAIGMKGWKVSLGMITETVAIVALCLVLGLGVGTAAAQPLADSLLEGQQANSAQEGQAGEGVSPSNIVIAGQPTSEPDVKPAKINLGMDATSLAQISGVSMGMVLLSSMVGMIAVNRCQPRKLLSEGK